MRKLALMLALVLSLTAFVGCSNDDAGADVEADADVEGEAVVQTGAAEGFGGPVTVEVTSVDGTITDVTVTDHEESIDDIDEVVDALEEIPAAIEEAGSTEGVEAVSGATVTSEAIIEAVNEAIAE